MKNYKITDLYQKEYNKKYLFENQKLYYFCKQ